MLRRWPLVLSLACLGALTVACYGRALFRGEQFAYRDAAHFYYPLYERVQQEWRAGRLPLWEPEENAGMPLLGNPTAAVLYPGKLVFAVAPTYAWGARLYVVAHTLLAFGAMFALLRGWGAGVAASGFGGLAYGFGGPVLFQYCNIIYLVGAAWLPLGFRAADRWLRFGRRLAIAELALVLAMEVLGGDPEVAYLTGLCTLAYAFGLSREGARGAGAARGWGWRYALLGVGLVVVWVAATLVMARVSYLARPIKANPPPEALPWMPYVAPAVAAAWGVAGLVVLNRWRRRPEGRRGAFVPGVAGLLAAALLGAAVAGAQLLPVLEFTGQSVRAAGDGPHDVYPFSLEPLRVVELLWPNVFGTPFEGNRSWHSALPATKPVKVWVPTLYLGAFTLAAALGAASLRRGPAPRAWMTGVAVVSLVVSFGEFTGPLYWARFHPALARQLGPHDTDKDASIRFDRHLRDGDGSFYWMLSTALPGFRQFRFPGKLLSFTVLGVAALGGLGLDALLRGEGTKRTAWWAAALLVPTLAALGETVARPDLLARRVAAHAPGSSFGPIDNAAAVVETRQGLLQGAVMLTVALGVALRGGRRPGLAAAVALGVTACDLGLANARYVLTVPQALMDGRPEALDLIARAEAAKPAPGPYRVHRMPIWNPLAWNQEASRDRVRDFAVWERDTLQPKYGIPYGLQYTFTMGVAELYDYEWFFGAFLRRPTPEAARTLQVAPDHPLVVYPRRGFDLWNTRYFLLPYYPNHWDDEHRGFASFLENTELVYPPPGTFDGPDREARELDWTAHHDFQIRRNLAAYPRAWVVHGARFLKPLRALNRADRDLPMLEILFSNDSFWKDATRTVYDPKELAWLDQEDRPALGPYLHGGRPDARETVTVQEQRPDRVELVAKLSSPGLVVLADVFYPGWTLTIDDKPAPVYRANRMMRGAAVPAGEHRLVYTFRPRSLRFGLAATAVGLLGLVAVAIWGARQRAGFADRERDNEGDRP